MATKPPIRGEVPNTVPAVIAHSRRFLLYGLAISILLHLLFGPLVQFRKYAQEDEKVEKVSVSKKVTKVETPKPTPTPAPTPTPKPVTQTPPPQTPPPHVVRLKVDVPKTTSNSESGPSESQYNVKSGSQQGVPGGEATGAPAAAAAPPATATPAPTPTRPACANPNANAVATDKVTPDMPEIARQMGATGTAQVRVSLDATGKVTGVSIYKSTNNRALDAAAVDAARQSRYHAEIKDCVAVAGSYLYTVTFENQ
jgi:TonB family protein